MSSLNKIKGSSTKVNAVSKEISTLDLKNLESSRKPKKKLSRTFLNHNAEKM